LALEIALTASTELHKALNPVPTYQDTVVGRLAETFRYSGVSVSEAHWKEFLQADGLEDWVVLHGGPSAVFLTSSLADAAELGRAVARLHGLEDSHTQLSIVSKRLTVRLTREIWKIEPDHITLAREISKIAKSLGAVSDPNQVQEVQFAIAAKADAIDLGFWRAVLGYDPMLEDNAIDPLGVSSTVWMQDIEEGKALRHAMHIDVSLSKESAQARVDAAVKAGGVVVDGSHAPSWWILADRSGNKVCVVAWPDGAKANKSVD
jgi:4a-hydroxytetrahydrobiopterin dehydratase